MFTRSPRAFSSSDLFLCRQQHGDPKLPTQRPRPVSEGSPQLLPLCGLHDDAGLRTGRGLDGVPPDSVYQQPTGERPHLGRPEGNSPWNVGSALTCFSPLAIPAGWHRPTVQILDGTAHDGHIQTHAASRWQSGVPLPSQCCSEGGAPAVAQHPSSCPGNAAALNHRMKRADLCDFCLNIKESINYLLVRLSI